MKKYFTLSVLTVLLCIFPNGKSSSQLQTHVPGFFEGDESDEITLNKLNCKPGLYRTYEDFKKGRPENLQFQYNGSRGMLNGFTFVGVFKDANGKTVKLTYDDFWGFKCSLGLFRCYKIVSKEGTPRSATGRISYVATDHVVYHTEPAENVYDANDRVSKDLNSEVFSDVAFEAKFKSHYKEMKEYPDKACPRPKGRREPAYYVGLSRFYDLNEGTEPAKHQRECLLATPNLKFVLNYHQKDIGNQYIAVAPK